MRWFLRVQRIPLIMTGVLFCVALADYYLFSSWLAQTSWFVTVLFFYGMVTLGWLVINHLKMTDENARS